MKFLSESLKNQFTIFNLGCIGNVDYQLPGKIVESLTVIEVDAERGAHTRSRYHRKIQVTTPIAGSPDKKPFFRNTFTGTCSLLRPRPGKVQEFGMQQYFDEIGVFEMERKIIPNLLLQREGISTLDFLETDVEGLDSDIIRSCETFFGLTLGFQAELRFDPFYQTEPCFHEIVSLLAGHGYEVLDIVHIDRRKYCTPHWEWQLEGRAVWADFVFFSAWVVWLPTSGKGTLGRRQTNHPRLHSGQENYGERLLQLFDATLPLEWKQEFKMLVRLRLFNLTQLRQSLRRQLMPLELLLKHCINRNRHVSIRLGN